MLKKLLVLLFLLMSSLSFSENTLSIGDKAIALQLEGYNQTSVRNGKPTLLKFWQSTCGKCKREEESLIEFYNKYHNEINILFISVDKHKKNYDSYLLSKEIDDIIPTYYDQGRVNTSNYRLTVTPTSILISPNGIIKGRWEKSLDWSKISLENLLKNQIKQ